MLDVAAFLQTNYTEFLAGKLTDEIEIKSGDQGRLIDSAKLLLKGLKPKDECDQVDSIYVGPVSILLFSGFIPLEDSCEDLPGSI